MASSTYFGTSINESATVVFPAGEKLENARGIAVRLKSDGTVAKPVKGENIIGLTIIETEDTVEAGSDVDIQVKDIGKWTAGGEISPGMELTTDGNGLAVEADAGDFIAGIALSAATEKGTWIKVQLTKSGYKAASAKGGN